MTEEADEFKKIPWSGGREQDITCKIVTIGSANVGKTSLIVRFAKGSFSSRPASTICVDFVNLNLIVREKRVHCCIWDTAGQETFAQVVATYMRDANLTLFIFDLTDAASMEDLRRRIEAHKDATQNCVCALIGTKFDLFERLPADSPEVRHFSQENLDNLASELGFVGGAHMVSSLSNRNVERALMIALNVTVDEMQKNLQRAETESLRLDASGTSKKNGCCKQ